MIKRVKKEARPRNLRLSDKVHFGANQQAVLWQACTKVEFQLRSPLPLTSREEPRTVGLDQVFFLTWVRAEWDVKDLSHLCPANLPTLVV